MIPDPRRLTLPEPVASDSEAFEILSVWVRERHRIMAFNAVGTGMDNDPNVWGKVLAGIANNLALSAERMFGTDRQTMLAAMKESLDAQWAKQTASLDPSELGS